MEKIFVLTHVDESGTALAKASLEAVSAAVELAKSFSAELTIGLLGADVAQAAAQLAGAAPKVLAVTGQAFAQPRYATDAAACEALVKAAAPTIVLAPSTARFARVMAGVAHRAGGAIDTHITAVSPSLEATRWFYRQRIEAVVKRERRPWFLLLDAGTHAAYSATGAAPAVEAVAVAAPASRTTVAGTRSPQQGEQTIRPNAKLLFVAGAGWTKKQSDGQVHAADAEKLILGFLHAADASLGSSKSLVDQSGENQATLKFMTHLNQIGQTGATPRHAKGLSTCCHGEEPHVVGWRFVNERRAINLDANCGWARGKADVVYLADAFQVMAKVNELLEK
ncbi:MAG: electron transfer flavoprotein subunit alpha [Acidobacteriota bacterium]|nr:electron transfer flavoprotein subunit alpha [Acidobacteriota bacterium]